MTSTDFFPTETLANPAEIRRCAHGLESITGVLLGHADEVGAVLSRVALSFSEVIAPAVAAQIGANVAALETAVETTVYGHAVALDWATDVEAFLTARDELIARWELAEWDDFGVAPPLNLVPPPPLEERQRLDSERRVNVGIARTAALDSFIAEGHRIWRDFQQMVDQKGRMFREGPTAGNLRILGSALGWGAMTLWPEFAPPPVAGADGAAAGETVLAGLDGATGPEAVLAALADVAAITRRAESGIELTSAEIDFLEAFYATMGVRVTEVPGYLSQASFEYTTRAPDPGLPWPGDDAPPVLTTHVVGELDPTLVTTLTAASANGLLVLSRNGLAGGGYDRLPAWVRDSLDDEIVPSSLPLPGEPGAFESLVLLGDFLANSNVGAGDGLSRELAVALNGMLSSVDGLEGLGQEGMPTWGEQVDAAGQSFLDVIARNDEVCFDLVTGSDMPDEYDKARFLVNMFSFEWSDDGAAAAGITDFIPLWATSDDPVGQARAETATIDLVDIVTGNRAFDALMDGVGTSGDASTSAIGQVNPAVAYGFASVFGSVPDLFAADGAGPLSFDAKVRFTTLIATDRRSGDAMAAALQVYEMDQTATSVTSGAVEAPGGQIGRLQRVVHDGLVAAAQDAGLDTTQAEVAADASQARAFDLVQSAVGTLPVIGDPASFAVEIFRYGTESQGTQPTAPIGSGDASAGPSEAERRFATTANVVQALIGAGVVEPSAVPEGLRETNGGITLPPSETAGPTGVDTPSVENYTDMLRALVTASGTDLTALLERIDAAYDHPY